jgi:ribose-phosphate pyrophosphokinase
MVTHAMFVEGAVQRLADAGVGLIISSDSIPHHTNQLSLVPMLADSLLELIKAGAELTPATCAV